MELKFNLNDISSRVSGLYSNINSNSKQEDIDNVNDVVDLYSDIYKNISPIDCPEKEIEFNKKSYSDVLDTFKSIFTYYPKDVSNFIVEISKKLTEKESFFDNFKEDFMLNSVDIGDQDVYNVLFDFFNKYAVGHKDTFEYLINNNLIHLKNEGPDLGSCCYYDFIKQIPYAVIHNTGDIYTYSLAVHEMAHAYWHHINKRDSIKDEFYLEVPSNLSQFLFNIDNIEDNEQLICLYNYFGILKQSFFEISLLDKQKNLKFKPERIKENFNYFNYYKDYDKEDVASYFVSIDCLDESSYAFSLILILHILKIFEKDREKGIYLYNNYVLETPSNYMKFLNGLEFDINDIDYSTDLYFKFEDKLTNQVRKRLK